MSLFHPDEPVFADRREAGRALARELELLRLEAPLVVALPRGGVPVAAEVAEALGAPLEILLVRKIGAPGQEEYGLGAVADGERPQFVVSDEVLDLVRPPAGYLEAEKARQLAELERRRAAYLGTHPAVPVEGRVVILVDDGIATGSTARVAIRALRQQGAKTIVLAIPVAPPSVVESLAQEADMLVCLATPEPFIAVGRHYAQFAQVGDDEVVALLRRPGALP